MLFCMCAIFRNPHPPSSARMSVRNRKIKRVGENLFGRETTRTRRKITFGRPAYFRTFFPLTSVRFEDRMWVGKGWFRFPYRSPTAPMEPLLGLYALEAASYGLGALRGGSRWPSSSPATSLVIRSPPHPRVTRVGEVSKRL